MGVSSVRQKLHTIVSSVSSAGNVHDYKRWAVRYDDLVTLFGDNGKLRGAEIEGGVMSSSAEAFNWDNSDVTIRAWTWNIHLYRSWDDEAESEKSFQETVENVLNAIEKSSDLRDSVYHVAPPTVASYEARLFGNVLVHYAKINVVISEFYGVE